MTLIALIGIISLTVALGQFIGPASTAHAKSSEAWLYLECLEDAVQ